MPISRASSAVLAVVSLLSTNRIFLITATRPTASSGCVTKEHAVEQVDRRALHRPVRGVAEEINDAGREHDGGSSRAECAFGPVRSDASADGG
jgi:hypothetical protein